MDIKPLFGLDGVLFAAMASEFNDLVTAIALTDIRGALGINHDSGTSRRSPNWRKAICNCAERRIVLRSRSATSFSRRRTWIW